MFVVVVVIRLGWVGGGTFKFRRQGGKRERESARETEKEKSKWRDLSQMSGGRFFLEWVTPHTKMFTSPKVEYPFSLVTKRGPKAPGNLFRVEDQQSRDAEDYGPTTHVN